MKLKPLPGNVSSLRRLVFKSLVKDNCLADKYLALCSLQPVPKSRSTPECVTYRIHHRTLPNILEGCPVRLINGTQTTATGPTLTTRADRRSNKPPVTDLSVPIEEFVPLAISTVLRHQGDHGVRSEIHKWLLSEDGTAARRQKVNMAIDFSSPNIAKPFHAGHLRSTLIGGFIARLKSSLGDSVTRINYLGDWGTQFGLLAVGYKLFGNETRLRENAISHLHDTYVKVNELVKSDPELLKQSQLACLCLEQGEEEITRWWRTFRQASVDDYSRIYKRLGVVFDEFEWESEHHVTARSLCEELLQRGSLHLKDGAAAVSINVKDKSRDVLLLKSDGSTLYTSRDVAAFLHRLKKYRCDKILYVVEQGQEVHFTNLSRIIDKLQLLSPNDSRSAVGILEHVKFGRVSGMSSRRGTAVLLADILDEARDRMRQKMENTDTTRNLGDDLETTAEQLATSAVIIYDLRLSRTKNYAFSWDDVLSLNADSGPFLQITHARLCSLEENCGIAVDTAADTSTLRDLDSLRLIVHLARYDEVIRQADLQLEAHLLVRYLFDLCHLTNAAFKRLRVKDEQSRVAQSRLLLFHCAKLTLANGLGLLGIVPLERI